MLEFVNIESQQERMNVYKNNPEALYQELFWHKRSGKHKKKMYYLGKVLTETFNIESLADFGCGVAGFIHGAMDAGAEVIGYELISDMAYKYASKQIRDRIFHGNAGGKMILGRKYDCCSSIEVAEHLLPEQADIFVDNLINHSNRMIVITTSEKSGYYHFNCKPKSWWCDKFIERNWFRNEEYEKKLMKVWNGKAPRYIIHNLMILSRCENG